MPINQQEAKIKPTLVIGADADDLAGARTLSTLAEGALETLPQDPPGWVKGKQNRLAVIQASMKLAADHRMASEKSTAEPKDD